MTISNTNLVDDGFKVINKITSETGIQIKPDQMVLNFYDGKNQELARWLLIARAWHLFWKNVPKTHQIYLLKIWNENKPVINSWLSIPNSFTAEAFGKMGWDAITIDMQHGQSDYSTSQR